MELPPESEFCEPISVSSCPSAPTRLMPYIGLCGLLPVSFSERAAIGKPFTMARVATCVDSLHAAQDGAVRVPEQHRTRC